MRKKEVQIKKKDKFREYILKDSVEKLGAIDIDENGCVVTRNNERYFVYRFYFETPVGIDYEINFMNKAYLHDLINALEHDFKVLYPSESKNILNNNISFYQKRLETVKSEKMKMMITQEIEIMRLMNETKSTNTILFISEEDDDMAHKAAVGIVLEKLDRLEIERLFAMINNEMG